MGAPAIEIDGVSKRFRLYQERATSLKERLVRRRRSQAEDFWALRDVSHSVGEGRSLGLVGANGSGKTTLLKIIGGILRPTSGEVRTRGRIAALLELGAGFHPELTGRENVYLNASLMGLSRKEVDRKFDAIVEFSELGRFIDNQVKFYSSGMFVRLGFSVAIHGDPDILLVDEVLAVGDEGFQRKCLEAVNHFQHEGRSIVLVSHSMDQVSRVCDQALMLHEGRVRTAGPVADVVREFRALLLQDRAPFVREDVTREIEILEVQILNHEGKPADRVKPGYPMSVQVDLTAHRPVEDPVVSAAIYDATDRLMIKTGTDWVHTPLGTVSGKRRVVFDFEGFPLTDGRYTVTVGVHDRDTETIYDWRDHQYAFGVDRSAGIEGVAWSRQTVRVEEP